MVRAIQQGMYEVMGNSIDKDERIWDDLEVVVRLLLHCWIDTSSVDDDKEEWVLSVEGQQV